MAIDDVIFFDASTWAAEDAQGQGNWCYAAVTQAVRGALLGEQRSQAEIAHDFYMHINTLGGPQAAGIGGTRGAAIANYANACGLAPGDPAMPYDYIDQWVTSGAMADPRGYLADAWGDFELTGLKQTTIRGLVADDPTEVRICQAIDAGGLAIVGTTMHCLVIYGYQLETDDTTGALVARRFHQWDPTNGATAAIDIGDHTGAEVTLVTT